MISQAEIRSFSDVFLNPTSRVNEDCFVIGQIISVRRLSKRLIFVIVKTPYGEIQCISTNRDNEIPSTGSYARFSGKLVENNDVVTGIKGYELSVSSIDVISVAEKHPPLEDIATAARRTRIECRHLDLRNNRTSAIFRVRSWLMKYTYAFFSQENFSFVNSPRLVGKIVGGPVSALHLDYFGKPCYLSIASILYHGIMISGGMEKVFEAGPLFRGSNTNTSISANEFTVAEYTAAYHDRNDMMALTEQYINYILDGLAENCQKELNVLGIDIDLFPREFQTVTFREAISLLNSNGYSLDWRSITELPKTSIEVFMKYFNGFFWILDQPESRKWFFVEDTGLLQSPLAASSRPGAP
jgi:aspartyl-tRNA synthetase